MIAIPPFDATQQYRQIGSEIERAVLEVLASGQYIGGSKVAQFEAEFARYIGTEFAIACNSGTDALFLVLRALGIGAGDEVIVPTFTFFSTAEAVSMAGATPVFVDTEAHSFNIDPAKVEAAITPRTRAMMPVHLFGRPAEMTPLMAIAQRHHLAVIEDCAQATGAQWGDRKVGSLGVAGCFSFYPTKNLGGCGDGGMVTTNDRAIANKVRMLREHGSARRYYHECLGVNSRLDALQAAILLAKLPYLDKWNGLRRQICDRYTRLLKDVPGVTLPHHCPGSVWNQYTIQIDRRDAVQAALREAGILTIVYYPVPIHLQEAYAHLGYTQGSLPVAEAICERVLSLPLFPEMTDAQQDRVVEVLQAAIAR